MLWKLFNQGDWFIAIEMGADPLPACCSPITAQDDRNIPSALKEIPALTPRLKNSRRLMPLRLADTMFPHSSTPRTRTTAHRGHRPLHKTSPKHKVLNYLRQDGRLFASRRPCRADAAALPTQSELRYPGSGRGTRPGLSEARSSTSEEAPASR